MARLSLSDDELLDLKHMEADAFRGGSKEMMRTMGSHGRRAQSDEA